MISRIVGTVVQITGTHVVLDLHGFGVSVLATPQTLGELRLGETATLATTLLVREDSLTLFGFSAPDDRELFELVQTVSGVGPKVALSVVSVFDAADFARVVRAGQFQALTKVPGIGPKSAQRIVLELKDKVAALTASDPATPRAATAQPWRDQVAAGLEGLGWSTKDAQAACEKVAALADADPEVTVAVLMRAALRTLAKV